MVRPEVRFPPQGDISGLGLLSTHCGHRSHEGRLLEIQESAPVVQRGVAFANQWVSKHIVSFAPEADPDAEEVVQYLVEAAAEEGISRAELEELGSLNDFIIKAWLAQNP